MEADAHPSPMPTFPQSGSITTELPRIWHGLQSAPCSAQGSDPCSNWRGYVDLVFLLPCFAHQEKDTQRGTGAAGSRGGSGEVGSGLI